jgi:hypothetical protein
LKPGGNDLDTSFVSNKRKIIKIKHKKKTMNYKFWLMKKALGKLVSLLPLNIKFLGQFNAS